MSDDKIFLEGYGDAREQFVAAAEAAGLRAFRVRVPAEDTPDLFIDFALAARDPSRVLVHYCGTHGVEGYAGSAVQRSLLAALPASPAGPSLLFVHAVNPYGMCFYRRANAENVDLNRNFLTGPLENPDYRFFDAFLNPRSRLGFPSGFLKGAFRRFSLGRSRTANAVASGQTEKPAGLFFAGLRVQRETLLIQDVLRTHLAKAQSVSAIEFHTGLGVFGGELLFVEPGKGAGDTIPRLEAAFARKLDIPDPDKGSYKVAGTFADAMRAALPGAEMRHVLQEIGTHSAMKVLAALRWENFEWNLRPASAPPSAHARALMLEAFFPRDPAWREGMLALGIRRWKEAHADLSARA